MKEEKKVYDASSDESFDNRAKGIFIYEEDDQNTIKEYQYKILIKNKPDLEGVLSRDEMELLCRLYVSEGANLTQKATSRYFPTITARDLKRILTAFGITKSNVPLAPHQLLELPTDEAKDLMLKYKEDSLLKKFELDQENDLKKLYHKTLQDKVALTKKLASAEELLQFSPERFKFNNESKSIYKRGKSIIIYLSDMHIGAHNDQFGIYDSPYNKEVVWERLSKVISKIGSDEYKNIVILNLEDSIDSYKRETSRGGHEMPTLMTDKEQSKTYLSLMTSFFNEIHTNNTKANINYYCIGESNHPGDWGWINNIALSQIISMTGVEAYVSDKPIDQFELNGFTFVYAHGKDSKNQNRGLPLVIDTKTENYINEYLDYNNIGLDRKIVFVKGDLHQSAITQAKRFTYHSVSSLFGSSNFIMANYGFTKWGCDYAIIDEYDEIVNGIIKD